MVSGLPWSEQEAVECLVGGLVSVAGLVVHRPRSADRVREAVIDQLGDDERELIAALATALSQAGAHPIADACEPESLGPSPTEHTQDGGEQ